MRSKKGLIVVIVILGVVLLGVGTFAVINALQRPAPVATIDTSKQAATKDTTAQTDTTNQPVTTTKETIVDPSTLASVDVEPLGITVFYDKGTPGFEFNVLKTADKTQYVEFTSSDLVGTKCTDDQGVFASIIKNPSSTEDQTTISKTVKVGNDTFGLSLASSNCTGNTDLLTQYQTAFTDGFANLSAL